MKIRNIAIFLVCTLASGSALAGGSKIPDPYKLNTWLDSLMSFFM